MVPPIVVYVFNMQCKKNSDDMIHLCVRLFYSIEKDGSEKGLKYFSTDLFCNGTSNDSLLIDPLAKDLLKDLSPVKLQPIDSLLIDSLINDLSKNTLPKIVRDKWTKPRFIKDIGVYFSVSHSADFWVCAVSRQNIGIDIQKKTNDYNKGISKRFFHTDEHEYLQQNNYDDFFNVWTAKESYVKYTGQGISDDFSLFSVVKNGIIGGKVNKAEIVSLPFSPDYSLSLCAKKIGKVYKYLCVNSLRF